MAYSLQCKDAGQDCVFACTASSEDELMQHVQVNVSAAHPDMELTPDTVTQVKSLIRTV
jgi:predicted small metal-binding protein